MNERVTTTNGVTDVTDMVTVKHRKKTRLRKGVTVAATKASDTVTDAPTNMFTNTAINTSAFASIDTSADLSLSDAVSESILIDTKTDETMTKAGSTTTGAPHGIATPNASTLLIGDGTMSDPAAETQDSSSSMESIRRGIWPQLRKDMKRMTHFMRKKISLSERRNRIKEISIKQQCWEDEDEPETTSKRTSRSTSSTTRDADRRSLSAGSSHATSSSSQSANSTPVVLDDYDEDEDV